MPQLTTVTVRTASRMPIGNGFQEFGVSLSYVINAIDTVIENVGTELSLPFSNSGSRWVVRPLRREYGGY